MKPFAPAAGFDQEILGFAERAVAPLVGWMVRSGIGYREFCLRLKHVFLRAAVAELERRGSKQTETALCVLSGLHRKDVHALMQGGPLMPVQEVTADDQVRRMVSTWMTEWRCQPLPFAGPAPSFENLAMSTAQGSALTALAELSRRAIVECRGDHVHLVKPDDATVSVHDAGETVADHLNAVVDQLSGSGNQLACSLLLEDLSPDSLQRVEDLARQAWSRAAGEVAQHARELSRQDAGRGWRGRYRFGMFGRAGLPGVGTNQAKFAESGPSKS